jgi:hypothetical protein
VAKLREYRALSESELLRVEQEKARQETEIKVMSAFRAPANR